MGSRRVPRGSEFLGVGSDRPLRPAAGRCCNTVPVSTSEPNSSTSNRSTRAMGGTSRRTWAGSRGPERIVGSGIQKASEDVLGRTGPRLPANTWLPSAKQGTSSLATWARCSSGPQLGHSRAWAGAGARENPLPAATLRHRTRAASSCRGGWLAALGRAGPGRGAQGCRMTATAMGNRFSSRR